MHRLLFRHACQPPPRRVSNTRVREKGEIFRVLLELRVANPTHVLEPGDEAARVHSYATTAWGFYRQSSTSITSIVSFCSNIASLPGFPKIHVEEPEYNAMFILKNYSNLQLSQLQMPSQNGVHVCHESSRLLSSFLPIFSSYCSLLSYPTGNFLRGSLTRMII